MSSFGDDCHSGRAVRETIKERIRKAGFKLLIWCRRARKAVLRDYKTRERSDVALGVILVRILSLVGVAPDNFSFNEEVPVDHFSAYPV